MDTFYMVWREQGNVPRLRHESYDTARVEAERIARLEKGPVFILKALEVVEQKEIPVTLTILDDNADTNRWIANLQEE